MYDNPNRYYHPNFYYKNPGGWEDESFLLELSG